MHLFRFSRSLYFNVLRTRNSILLASRYFCTDRMILMAHLDLLRLSYASTTLPKVPWPSSLRISSVLISRFLQWMQQGHSHRSPNVPPVLTSKWPSSSSTFSCIVLVYKHQYRASLMKKIVISHLEEQQHVLLVLLLVVWEVGNSEKAHLERRYFPAF